MSVPLRSVGGALFVARLSGEEIVAVVAALEQRARAYLSSAERLLDGLEALSARDRVEAERIRALAARLQRLTRGARS